MPKKRTKRVSKIAGEDVTSPPATKRARKAMPKKKAAPKKRTARKRAPAKKRATRSIAQIRKRKLNTLVTETPLPVPSAGIHGSCKVCQLAVTDFEAFRVVNIHLIGGGSVPMIQRWCQDRGLDQITKSCLGHHKRRHLDTWLDNALKYRMAAEAVAAVTEGADPEDRAISSLRRIDLIITDALVKAKVGSPEEQEQVLKGLVDGTYDDLLKIQSTNAARLSAAEYRKQQARRAERDLQLKELLIAEKQEDHIADAEGAYKQVYHMVSSDAQAEIDAAFDHIRKPQRDAEEERDDADGA